MKSILRKVFKYIFNKLPRPILNHLINGKFFIQQFRHYLSDSREVTLKIDNEFLGKIRILICPKYPIEREILINGCYDKESISIFNRIISKDFICLDVGANIGSISFALCNNLGPNGKVYAFEPGPNIFGRLSENVRMNPSLDGRLELIKAGLADKEKELYWAEVEDNPGNAEFSKNNGIKIELTTLDALVKKEKLEKVDFIKIDVEGMEIEVIKGGLSTIRDHKPLIYYESKLSQERWVDSIQQIEVILEQLGYSFYKFETSKLKKVRFPNLDINTLAVHSEKESIIDKFNS